MAHAHHLEMDGEQFAGNGGRGRIALLPGSPGRAASLAEHLTDPVICTNRRRMDVVLGRLEGPDRAVDLAVVPTGMGCPSVDIIVGELIACGVTRFLRIGTTGTMQDHVAVGDVVIASAAVRDESTSDVYVPPSFPALGDPLWVRALEDAAVARGLERAVHTGVVHTKDSFYGRQLGQGPDVERNQAYMRRLAAAGVLATEMEVAHLFVLGQVHDRHPRSVAARRGLTPGIRCGALLAVIGHWITGPASHDVERAAVDQMIALALAGVLRLDALEQTG